MATTQCAARLLSAIELNDLQTAHRLLGGGADLAILACPLDDDLSVLDEVLYRARYENDCRLLGVLLLAGMPASYVHKGQPLLFDAVHTSPEMVRLLLQCGADPNAHDASGRTALLHAAHAPDIAVLDPDEWVAIVEVLLANGAVSDVRSPTGASPRFIARIQSVEGDRRMLEARRRVVRLLRPARP